MNSISNGLAVIYSLAAESAALVSLFLVFANPSVLLAQSQGDGSDIVISSAIMTVLEVNTSNCASYNYRALETFACQSEVGSYQAGRLAHAVEAFAVSLQAAGVSTISSDIQRSIYEDIAHFGVYRSISVPAMNLVDLSHSQSSPFGQESNMVSATSMIALEYLHPGVLEATGTTFEEVAGLAGLNLTDGPRDFESYMAGYAGRPTELSSLRLFGEFQDSAPILQKYVASPDQILTSGGNLLSDYYFEEPIALDSRRSSPLGQLVSLAGMVAYNSGRPLTNQHQIQDPENFQVNFLGDTPFSGIACTLCAISSDQTGSGVEAGYVSAPLFTEEFSVASITVAAPEGDGTLNPAHDELESGIDLMSAASSGAEASNNSPSSGNQIDSVGTSERVACYAACGVAEILTEGGDVIAESFKTAKDLLLGEGKDAYRQNLNDVVEEVKDVTQIPNRCVETCENLDNPLDEDDSQPVSDEETAINQAKDENENGDDAADTEEAATAENVNTASEETIASADAEDAPASVDVTSTSVPDNGGTCDPDMEGEGGCDCHVDYQGMMLMPCTPNDGGDGSVVSRATDESNFGQTRWLFREPTQPDRLGAVFSVFYDAENSTDEFPIPVLIEVHSTGSGFLTDGGDPMPSSSGVPNRLSLPIFGDGGVGIPPPTNFE